MVGISLSSSEKISNLIPFEPPVPLPLPPLGSYIPLNEIKQNYLAEMIGPEFKFNLPRGSRAPILLKTLIANFHQRLSDHGISLDSLKLTGSSVTKGLFLSSERTRDIDFLGRLNVSVPKDLVKKIFLEALAETLGVCRQDLKNNQYSFSYKGRQLDKVTIDKESPPPNLFENRKGRLLEALTSEENFFLATLPFWRGDQKISVDIRIVWGAETFPQCISSDNCFQYETLPFFLRGEKAAQVTAAPGYCALEAFALLQQRLFSMNEKQILHLRDGVRAYARIPTKGLLPIHYRYEAALIAAWKNERATFFSDLKQYVSRHYGAPPYIDRPAAIAYLLNLRAIFASADLTLLPDREAFLEIYDKGFKKHLFPKSEIDPNNEDEKEPLIPDPAPLRALAFWSYLEDSAKSRCDCPDGIHPTRFLFPFAEGTLFIPPPWNETAELLCGDPKAMLPYLGTLGFPQTVEQVREHLSNCFNQMSLVDPLAPLFQWFLNKDSTLEKFIPLFYSAFNHLRESDLVLVKQLLLKRGFEKMAECIDLIPKPRHPISFINSLLKHKIEPDDLFSLMKTICQKAPSFPALLSGIKLSFQFSIYKDELWNCLSQRIGHVAPEDLRTPLFRWLLTKDPTLDKFIPIFLSAIPHLSPDNWTLIKEILQIRGWDKLYRSIQAVAAPIDTFDFLEILLANKVKTEALLGTMKMACAQISSAQGLHKALKLAPSFKDRELDAMIEAQFWKHARDSSDTIIQFYLQRPLHGTLELIRNLESIFRPEDPKMLERWIGFWLKEVELHPRQLDSLLNSRHFTLNEETSLIHSALQGAYSSNDYPAFFSCFEKASKRENLPIKAIELLQKVGLSKDLEPDICVYVIQSIYSLSESRYEPKVLLDLIRRFPLASWLKLPRVALLCWKILQNVTNHRIDAAGISESTIVDILQKLFGPLNRRDFLTDLVLFATEGRLPLAQTVVVFARAVRKDPTLLLSNAETVQELLCPFAENPTWAPSLASLLMDPSFAKLGSELLPVFGSRLKMDQCQSNDRIKILEAGFQFLAPEEFRKVLIKALQSEETAKRPEMAGILLRLSKEDFDHKEVRVAIEAYLSTQRQTNFSLLKHLLETNAADPSFIWIQVEQNIPLNKKSVSGLLELSLLCLQMANKPIARIETYWQTNMDSPSLSLLPELQALHALPFLTPKFKDPILKRMKPLILKTNKLLEVLRQVNPEWPPSHVFEMAQEGIEANLSDQTLEFLLKNSKKLFEMPPFQLSTLLNQLSKTKVELRPLVEITLRQIGDSPNPEENLQALGIDLFLDESMLDFQTVHSDLFRTNLDRLSTKSLRECWMALKTLFENKKFPFQVFETQAVSLMKEKIKIECDKPETLIIYRDFATYLPFNQSSTELLDLFELLVMRSNEAIYLDRNGARIVEIIAGHFFNRASSWIGDEIEVEIYAHPLFHTIMTRLQGHFTKFLSQNVMIESETLIHFAKLANISICPGKGAEILVRTLTELSQRPLATLPLPGPPPISHNKKKGPQPAPAAAKNEQKNEYWVDLWLGLCSIDSNELTSFGAFLRLLQSALKNKAITQEDWLASFFVTQFFIFDKIKKLGNQVDPILIRRYHTIFLNLYPWVIDPARRELTVHLPIQNKITKGSFVSVLCLLTHLKILKEAYQFSNFSEEVIQLFQFIRTREQPQAAPSAPRLWKPPIPFKTKQMNTLLQDFEPLAIKIENPLTVAELAFRFVQNIELEPENGSADNEKIAALATFAVSMTSMYLSCDNSTILASDFLIHMVCLAKLIKVFPSVATVASRVAYRLLLIKDENQKYVRFQNALEFTLMVTEFIEKNLEIEREAVQSLFLFLGPFINEFKQASAQFQERKKGKKEYVENLKSIDSILKIFAKTEEALKKKEK